MDCAAIKSNNIWHQSQVGIGLRHFHYAEFIDKRPKVGWVEVHPENYFGLGIEIEILENVRRDYPISFHGVNLSLGSFSTPNILHLKKIKNLIDRFSPFLFSDHISWGEIDGIYLNDLLPIPFNKESLDIVARNIEITQNYLKREIAVENPSSYLEFASSEMSETDFINQLLKKTGCKLLLDINNVYVNSFNHGFNAQEYLDSVNLSYVSEIHLAGHAKKNLSPKKDILIDTHDRKICNEVWDLFEYYAQKNMSCPTLIEWDNNPPSLDELVSEACRAEKIISNNNVV